MSELFTEGDQPSTEQPDSQPQQQAAPQPSISIPDSVKGMIGEGKKYKTLEEALASIPHAQSHIETIEKENEQLRQKAEGTTKLDQILQRLDQPKQEEPQQTTTTIPSTGEIVQAVKDALKQEASIAQRESNAASVKAALIEKYGDKAKDKSEEIAKEFGVTPEEFYELSTMSPKLILNSIGAGESKTTPRPTSDIIEGKPPVGEERPRKTVMFGASTKDIVESFRSHRPTA